MSQEENKKHIINKLPLYFIYCFIGNFATIYLVAIDINPIIASSLISIIVAFFTIIIKDENHMSWATFCGSFAGMTTFNLVSLGLYPLPFSISFLINTLILSSITSILYSLSEIISFKNPRFAFDGYGGRLGTIAFISVISFIICGKNILKADNLYIIPDFNIFFNITNYDFLAIPSAVIAALISMEIKSTVSSLNENYKVVTVATTGLIGGILVTKIPTYGYFLGQAWYTGAFVGMSSYFILMLKRDFIITGLLSGILLILTKNMFIGLGGKLGFLSFFAVLIMRIFYISYNKISQFSAKNPEAIVESLRTGKEVSNQAVDDSYAEKLVESLMKAQESGEKINIIDENIAGSFVIGEKIDFDQYEEAKEKNIMNLEYMSPPLQKLVHFFNSINITNWMYLTLLGDTYSVMAYQGISELTVSRSNFFKDSKFVNLLNIEKRIIGFSEKGINQAIFMSRFEKEELVDTGMLIIFPITENNELQGFFILFDKKDKECKNNLKIIKDHFNEILK
ncbi:MAG: hypothetical protein A2086_15720 [Spirochaetes bacterium GWD1_27_9]|nr:MAG: hypothetical protein A2Z98_10990 [Spirochaetes bacterium GWB1_27_13]OHD22472.1 MAG: hypothetical protein A2Y34_06630 [Spirochaetes bacterium GWC1_27_15]OHD42829.1 MAG: hypothetical protein A2086_15720 [Spirochaetes bacterium GWD1_27_9]